jgi:hypothetical protein
MDVVLSVLIFNLFIFLDLQAQEATQRRKTDTLRKQYTALTEEFKQLQQDSERSNEAVYLHFSLPLPLSPSLSFSPFELIF